MKEVFEVNAPEAFDPIAQSLIASHPEGAAILLEGPLGAGKSTFVARFAKQLGYDETASPTFGIMHEYGPNLRHYDLYRVGSEGFFARGLHETLEEGWALIEWPDERLKNYLETTGMDTVQIAITPQGDKRIVEVSA